MDDLIFENIKKLIGFSLDYNAFDTDILVQINMAFDILYQLGVVNEKRYIDKGTTWGSFNFTPEIIGMVKDYVYMKSKRIFDPPASSCVMEAIDKSIAELEWRLNVAVDHGGKECD